VGNSDTHIEELVWEAAGSTWSAFVQGDCLLKRAHGLHFAPQTEDWKVNKTLSGVPQGGLCKALHNPPYAKWKAMQSKGKKSLKLLHVCPIYFA